MKNVLVVTSSPRGGHSHSTAVATEFARSLGGRVIVRDLNHRPLTMIGPDYVAAAYTSVEQRTADQEEILRPSDQLIKELKEADIVVIAAGMINFGMPASLKTWIDHVTRAGITFTYADDGPRGLLIGKQAILVLSYGGVYSKGPHAALNYLEPALRTNLAFLGIHDVRTITIEGTSLPGDTWAASLESAKEQAATIAESLRDRRPLAA